LKVWREREDKRGGTEGWERREIDICVNIHLLCSGIGPRVFLFGCKVKMRGDDNY